MRSTSSRSSPRPTTASATTTRSTTSGSLADGNVSLNNLKGIGTAVTGTLLALPPTFNSVPANTAAANNVTPVLVQNTGDLPLTITDVSVGGVPGGPNDAGRLRRSSATRARAPAARRWRRAAAIPSARGTCVVNVGFKPTKTNYTSVARLNFTSGADTATENVLLVGKSTGDSLVTIGGNVQSIMQLAIPNVGGSFGTFVPGIAHELQHRAARDRHHHDRRRGAVGGRSSATALASWSTARSRWRRR